MKKKTGYLLVKAYFIMFSFIIVYCDKKARKIHQAYMIYAVCRVNSCVELMTSQSATPNELLPIPLRVSVLRERHAWKHDNEFTVD